MNHEKLIENNIDEHDAIWEAISQLEDTVKEQRKELELRGWVKHKNSE